MRQQVYQEGGNNQDSKLKQAQKNNFIPSSNLS